MFRNRFIRTVGVMVLLFVLAASMYAFTATNTFDGGDAGNAGIGAGDVSGYDVSNIEYTFAADDPSQIASVSFNLDGAAGEVQAKGNNGDWATCTASLESDVVNGPTWTCAIDVETEGFTSLEVAAKH